MPVEQQIKEFFDRIDDRYQEEQLPDQLRLFISSMHLKAIYKYIKDNKVFLKTNLFNGNPYRLDKKYTRLARTFNIIYDEKAQSFFLILETKSKKLDGSKIPDNAKELFNQSLRRTKSAWIIDGSTPIKIANTVFYDIRTQHDLSEVRNEVEAVNKIVDLYPNSKPFLNKGIFGKILTKNSSNDGKISLYSEWPEGRTLSYFLATAQGQVADCDSIALMLLEGVKYIHDAKLVYQRLSSSNILVFKNKENGYQVKFSGFMNVSDAHQPKPSQRAKAEPGYESPEIIAQTRAMTYKGKHTSINSQPSYAETLSNFIFPNPDEQWHLAAQENDVWALGVVLCRLYHKVHPSLAALQKKPELIPLLNGLLSPIRKERVTADQALEMFTKQRAESIAEYKKKVDVFFEKIKKRQQDKVLSSKLWGRMGFSDLLKIYDYVILHESEIRQTLDEKRPLRIDKKNSHLSKTLNFIISETEGISLILETKSKNHNNKKSWKNESASGAHKTTKKAFAIEGEAPKKIANSVCYLRSNDDLLKIKAEVAISHDILRQFPNSKKYLQNQVSMGAIIHKAGIRFKEEYVKKVSVYSPWAKKGDLQKYLCHKYWDLTPDEAKNIAEQIIEAVSNLHEAGVVHQDIKPENFLVYQDENKKPKIILADFGSAYKTEYSAFNYTPCPTLPYVSPQIAVMMLRELSHDNDLYEYYSSTIVLCYGRQLSEDFEETKPEYWRPHWADDIWALGVLIYQLYNQGRFPQKGEESFFTELVRDMLQPDREQRLTAKQLLSKHFPKKTPELDEKQSPESLLQKMATLNLNQSTHKGHGGGALRPYKAYQPQYQAGLRQQQNRGNVMSDAPKVSMHFPEY